jgi:hypothetical protein
MLWDIPASTKGIINLGSSYAHCHKHSAGLRMNIQGKVVVTTEDASRQQFFSLPFVLAFVTCKIEK